MQALRSATRNFTNSLRHSLRYYHRQNLRNMHLIAFSDKYLLYTNVAISVSLSTAGDILEQYYEIFSNELDSWDRVRTQHMGFSGLAVGVICHHWYKVLDKFIVGRSIQNVIKKLILDQMICSPVVITAFFASVAIFENNPIESFTAEVKEKFWTLYAAEWYVWPPAQIFNFYFLPTKYRVLYDNTISLGYDVYTSQVKHSKPKKIEEIMDSTIKPVTDIVKDGTCDKRIMDDCAPM